MLYHLVQDPTGPTAQAFLELGAAVVREVSLLCCAALCWAVPAWHARRREAGWEM